MPTDPKVWRRADGVFVVRQAELTVDELRTLIEDMQRLVDQHDQDAEATESNEGGW